MKYLLDKIAFVLGNLLMAGIFVFGVYKMVTVKSLADAVVAGTAIAVCGVLSGILFYLLYIRHWVEGFWDIIFSPRRKYKSLLPNLSPIMGYIQAEKYDHAREDLEFICTNYPNFLNAYFMLFELYCDYYQDYDQAYLLGKKYFSSNKREVSDNLIKFVFRYADLLQSCELADECYDFLQQEYKKSVYSQHEKKMISLRLENM